MRTRTFRRSTEPLPLDAKLRQSRAVNAAHQAFGSVPIALAFLNTPHDGLQGRPIDLAVGSEKGCDAVEGLLAAMAPPARGAG